VVFVGLVNENDVVAMATEEGRALLFPASGARPLGAGQGRHRDEARGGDRVLGAAVFGEDEAGLARAREPSGTIHTLTKRYAVVGRAGRASR
jgi:DNA gyrase/topoisomerase IV subunit A